MTKIQKIWLSLSLAMFLIPEVLWSPVGNFVYSMVKPLKNGSAPILRNNFLLNTDNVNIYSSVLFIQLVGSICYFLYSITHSNNVKHKWSYGILAVFSFLFAVAAFFSFGFSVSLRNVGF